MGRLLAGTASGVQQMVILLMSGRDGCESCVSSDNPHHRMASKTAPTRLEISATGNHSAYLPIDNDSCETLSVELCFETPIQCRVSSVACDDDDDAARSTVSVTQDEAVPGTPAVPPKAITGDTMEADVDVDQKFLDAPWPGVNTVRLHTTTLRGASSDEKLLKARCLTMLNPTPPAMQAQSR
jgi:hypothetical protein